MAQLSFANRRGRGVNSSGNGARMYAETNELRERAKSRNAYVYRFLTSNKDHHDEVLRFLTHDEQGPRIQIETDGCGNTWAKSGSNGPDSGRGQKILIAEDQMDQIRSWLESIEDKTNGKYMQESECAFQMEITPAGAPGQSGN